MSSVNLIERSFELAAERCADLTPPVYRRLHAEHPETLTMFRTEGSELVKGSMLAMTIEAILDFAGPRSGKFRMIQCEVMSHDAYGTPRELFIAFFGVIRDALHDVLGGEWTRDIDEAWERLLADIAVFCPRLKQRIASTRRVGFPCDTEWVA
jgi:hemoglobin-like flavoprotein